MPAAPAHAREQERLEALWALSILDTEAEPAFDALVAALQTALDAPATLISLVDEDRQWFKARIGIEACQTPRSTAFCAHAILSATPTVVTDATEDPRFSDNPLVLGPPHIRAYLGAPLISDTGLQLGTLCAIDTKPRIWSVRDIRLISSLATTVSGMMTLRASAIEAKACAERLAETSARADAMVSAMAEGLVVQGADGAIVDANPAAQQILGLTLEQMLGRTSMDPRWRAVDLEGADFPGHMHPSMVALRTGKAQRGVFMGIEAPEFGRRWIRINAIPIVPSGQLAPNEVVTTFQDVTTELDACENLKLEHERLELALGLENAWAWEVDLATGQASASPNMSRVLRDHPTLEGFENLIHWEDRDRVRRGRIAAMESGQDWSDEFRVLRGDGVFIWLSATARIVRGDRGRARLIALSKEITAEKRRQIELELALQQAELALRKRRALLTDLAAAADGDNDSEWWLGREEAWRSNWRDDSSVLERLSVLMDEIALRDEVVEQAFKATNEARAKAQAASQAKSDFLANMSHELRTPLNAIIGFAELIEEAAQLAGRSAEAADAERILSAANRLLVMINEILDHSKIEAGRMRVESSEFDPERLVREVVDTLRPAAEANRNLFTMAVSGALGPARTDAFKVSQCLLNLASNALKFTNRGTVTISVRREPREGREALVFDVTDTGVGIAPEVAGNLFQPFRQGHASAYGGTGLGLAITRRLARLLGGDVSLKSAMGQGSTFTLWVPAEYEPTAQAAASDARAA